MLVLRLMMQHIFCRPGPRPQERRAQGLPLPRQLVPQQQQRQLVPQQQRPQRPPVHARLILYSSQSTGQLSTCQIVNRSIVNMSTCQIVKLSTSQHVNLSTGQHVNLSTCQHVKLSNCQIVNFSSCQHVPHGAHPRCAYHSISVATTLTLPKTPKFPFFSYCPAVIVIRSLSFVFFL